MTRSDLCEGYGCGLVLVLAGAIVIASSARGAFKKQHLHNSLVCIHSHRTAGAVGEFEGQVSSPTCFAWGQIGDNPHPGISRLADEECSYVLGDGEALQGDAEAVAVGREDEVAAALGVVVQRGRRQVGGRKGFGVDHHGGGGVGLVERAEGVELLVREAQVVAVAGEAVAQHLAAVDFADELGDEGVDHPGVSEGRDLAVGVEHGFGWVWWKVGVGRPQRARTARAKVSSRSQS